MDLIGKFQIMCKNVTSLSVPALLLFLVFMCCEGCQVAPKKLDVIPLGDYKYVVDYTEYRIHQLIRRHHLPSVAVALIDDQNTVWQKTFGWANVEKKIPAQSDTVYKLWSVAKVFTVIEMMRLVEEGLVDIDAPLTDYIPGFSIQSRFPDSRPITIRSILAHHSGLPRNSCHMQMPGPGNDKLLGVMARSMKDGHMVFPVGFRFKYSNIGPDILGHIIQESRRKSFAYYMEENLLARIGMEDSSFLGADIPAQKDVAMGYEYYKGKYYPRQQDDINSLPSGNLYSTLEDMSTFVKFMFRGGKAGGEQIIKPETLKLMYENQYSSRRDPQPMGLGWKIARVPDSELLVWHDGGPSEGIGALVAFLPERKLGIVLLSNATSFESSISVTLAVDIIELMLETKYDILPSKDEIPEEIKIDRSRLQDYAGRYIVFGKVMDVSTNGNRLKGRIHGITLDLIPVDQTRFRVSHWLLKLGLAGLFNLPIDLRELEIEFLVGDESGEDAMIINIGDITYEICPKYPDLEDIPVLWKNLVREYEIMAHLPSGSVGTDVLGHSKIWMEDDVLQMVGSVGPILPVSETEIIIQSGPFVGETMVYESATGNIYHQSVVFKPTKP
jgi:CubicO group peptidase (beta-lactamase class C family)